MRAVGSRMCEVFELSRRWEAVCSDQTCGHPGRVLLGRRPWRCVIDRIEALIAPGAINGLGESDEATLRAFKSEATAVENSVSYYRRLAQGRIEILEAERDRRARGGSLSELIDALPRILGGEAIRSNASESRLVEPDLEFAELHWDDGREQLVTGDDSLAALPVISDDELGSVLERLQAFERELSDDRRRLHDVIDVADHALAARAAAGM
jgi:hypothetical protein